MHFRRRFFVQCQCQNHNASLKFLIKVPTQKAKFYKNLYINQISQTNFKGFSNQCSDTASILSSLNSSLPSLFSFFAFLSFYTKQVFVLSILFKSHLIRHSDTRRAFKGTQRALEHLRHSGSTRALGEHLGTRALKALGHWDT